MASSSPRMSSDRATDFIWPQILAKPIPPSVVKFVCDYDISSMGKMLSAPDGRPFKEKMEAFRKNLESFKKPKAHEALVNIDECFEDDEDDEDEKDDDELMDDEKKKRASDVELQVPTGGEASVPGTGRGN